jgi:hypothetical protein
MQKEGRKKTQEKSKTQESQEMVKTWGLGVPQ